MKKMTILENVEFGRIRTLVHLVPKTSYVDAVLESISCLTVTQIAQELNMTSVELNRLLCRYGIQYARSGQYHLYAKYVHLGLAQNRTFSFYHANGRLHTITYLVWTEKGRYFIHQLFNQNLNN